VRHWRGVTLSIWQFIVFDESEGDADQKITKALLDKLAASQSNLFFVQIGSNDGCFGDPLNQFYKRKSQEKNFPL
jgi:hypothetical protein